MTNPTIEGAFDSDPVTLASSSVYQEVLRLPVQGAESILIDGLVGSGHAIGDLKMEWSSIAGEGAVFTTYRTATDWDTPDVTMPAATSGLATTAASGQFKIMLAHLGAVREIRFLAKNGGGSTTLRLRGTVQKRTAQR